jgi:WD40 repeat protein
MEKRLTTLIVVLSSLLFLSPVLSLGEGTEDLKQGLVRITAESRAGERTTVGAGTIVELKGDYALILTAASVVADRRGLAVGLASDPDKAIPITFVNMEGGEPHGVAALFVEGEMPAQASALELANWVSVQKGDAVVSPSISDAGRAWTLIEGEITDRRGRVIGFSHHGRLTQPGGPLIKDGQVIGVATELGEASGFATPALLASYALEGWGVLDRKQSELAGTLSAESIALLHQVKHRTPEQMRDRWTRLIREEVRADLLRRSLLLAAESLRRSPSINARMALHSGLALLAYPVLKTDATTEFAFSPDGKFLATAHQFKGSADNLARIWKVATGKERGRLWLESEPTSLRFSPDGKYLAIGTMAGTVHLWAMDNRQPAAELAQDNPVRSLVFTPDGKYLAVSGSQKGAVRLWAMESRQQAAELAHDVPVQSLVFTPDGSELLTMTWEKASTHLYLWDVATAGKRLHLDQPGIASFVLGPKGKYLAARSKSGIDPGYLWIWELPTGNKLLQAQFEYGSKAIAISADGRYLAASIEREPARVWSLAEGHELFLIPSVGTTLAFSPDSRYLAIGSSVWDLSLPAENGMLLPSNWSRTLTHEEDAFALAFSPDGRYLASGSRDGTARVLALSSGEELARFTLFRDVNSLRNGNGDFSPDGRYLAARDHSFGLWRLWPDDLVSEVCRCVRRNLTYEEWRRYIGDEPYRKTCELEP